MNDIQAVIDDAISTGSEPAKNTAILVADSVEHAGHRVPEAWLRSRVRGWMELIESLGDAWWIGAYTDGGKWISCGSHSDQYVPKEYRQKYARDVCAHLNKHIANDGAWLAGWVRGGREFYLLWKDKDGDIQIPIECDKPFIALQKWALTDWERHAVAAMGVWSEWHKNLELGKAQTVALAQGEKVSQGHGRFMPPVAR